MTKQVQTLKKKIYWVHIIHSEWTCLQVRGKQFWTESGSSATESQSAVSVQLQPHELEQSGAVIFSKISFQFSSFLRDVKVSFIVFILKLALWELFALGNAILEPYGVYLQDISKGHIHILTVATLPRI